VAADEGVMPQTVEHLEICRLLGIRNGLVALTKADLVDAEMLALAEEDVRDLTRGTFLDGSPVVPFSSVTQEGHETLRHALDRIAQTYTERRSDGPVRLPIDRVFTMKGFGTVLTGTLLAGTLHVGDTVDVLPSGLRAKIRGLQVHNRPVREAAAGSRTAINLQGVEKAMVQRGEILAEPGRFPPSFRVNVHLEYRPGHARPLQDRFRVMVHWGTTRVFGRIRLLTGPEPLEPGGTGFAQIQLERPIFPVYGDRLIVRDFSTNQTLGGGVVLDPDAVRFKSKQKNALLSSLERLHKGDPGDRVLYALRKRGSRGATHRELSVWTGLGERETLQVLEGLAGAGDLLEADPEQHLYLCSRVLETLQESLREQIRAFHEKQPLQSGMPKEAAGGVFKEPAPDRIVAFALARMAEQGEVVVNRDRVRLAVHRVRLSEADEALCRTIRETFMEKGLMPPTVKELAEQTDGTEQKLRPLLDYLANGKELVKVNETLYFSSPIIEALRGRLVEHLGKHGEIVAADFKTLSQTTRKYTIPLMEYFDRTRLTLRLGDRRVLREKRE